MKYKVKRKRTAIKISAITYGRTINLGQGELAKLEMSAELPRTMTVEAAVNRLEILVKSELDKRFRRFR